MRVSILINNYNYGEFVGRAVESALAQEHSDVEVVVVDDGSSDGSVAAVRAFGSRVQLVTKDNGGQGSAYNTGFLHATGDIVIFLDADDWLYPNAVAEVIAGWKAGMTKAQFRLALVNREGEPTGRYVPRTMNDTDAPRLIREFGAYGSPPGSGNAFAAHFLRKILPLDEGQWRTAADTVPILLAPLYGDISSIPRTLGAYRLHKRAQSDDLLSGNAPEGLWHEYLRIESTKSFVEKQMLRLKLKPRAPLAFAPWESRIVALCIRFGGPPPNGLGISKARLALRSMSSVWRWPPWTWTAKLTLSTWLILLFVLPPTAARKLATRHRTSIGAQDNPATSPPPA